MTEVNNDCIIFLLLTIRRSSRNPKLVVNKFRVVLFKNSSKITCEKVRKHSNCLLSTLAERDMLLCLLNLFTRFTTRCPYLTEKIGFLVFFTFGCIIYSGILDCFPRESGFYLKLVTVPRFQPQQTFDSSSCYVYCTVQFFSQFLYCFTGWSIVTDKISGFKGGRRFCCCNLS